MKKLSTLFLMLVSFASFAQNWTRMNTGTTVNLRDVFFVSADTGFAVGEDSTLLYTTDRGSSWTTLSAVANGNPGNLNAIWMNSSSSGFIAPEFLLNIPQTTNGGQSWSNASSLAGNPCFPDGLFFDGPNEGYIYGKGCFGATYISSWNGNTWGNESMIYNQVIPSSFDYVSITGVAKDPAGPAYVAVTNYGKIFRSTDGFLTWDTIAYPDTTAFTAVDYAGNNTFYASSSQVINSVYISTDGGQTFAYDQSYMPTFYYSGFYDIDMLTNGFGVVAGFSQTTGGGFIQMRSPSQAWNSFNSYFPVNEIMRAVFVVDSTLAFAAGDSGAIYRYELPTGVGMSEQSAPANLNVYPSVVQNGESITAAFPSAENWNLRIFDACGKQIAAYTDLRGEQQIGAFAGTSGIYLLRAEGTESGRIAVSRVVLK